MAESETSSIGSKSRSTTYSIVSSQILKEWNEEETGKAVACFKAILDAMAYRGFCKSRLINMERMNAYVTEQFGLAHLAKESTQTTFRVQDISDDWKFIYDLEEDLNVWKDDKTVQLALSTLEFLPVFEIQGSVDTMTDYQALIDRRHDNRIETSLLDAMSPDWGDASWYTTPASSYVKEHGPNATIGIVVRTPFARSRRTTVGKNELYNLHTMAQAFGFTTVVYLSYEPLTTYSQRVIEQKQIATQVEFFHIPVSQYNIMRHCMVPYYRMLTEKGIKVLEERHAKKRDFFPRLPKSDPVVKWMQFPSHSMVLEVPHLGFGYDASRFCYVLAVREGDEEGDEEEEEPAAATGAGATE